MKNSYLKKRRDRNVDVFRLTDSCLISLFHEYLTITSNEVHVQKNVERADTI